MEVREINDPSDSDWLEMRGQFWSHLDPRAHRAELAARPRNRVGEPLGV